MKFYIEVNYLKILKENKRLIKKTLNDKEQFFIKKYNTVDREKGYNITIGGDAVHQDIKYQIIINRNYIICIQVHIMNQNKKEYIEII